MLILISPAKRMRQDLDSLPPESLPCFQREAGQVLGALRALDFGSLKKLWAVNDLIAKESSEALWRMEDSRPLTPALLAYDGIQYAYMAPKVFTDQEYDYVKEHLRILSGFYGLLRPFDGVSPYRLEMQAKLSVEGSRNLYGFWNTRLAKELEAQDDCVMDLASKEYSKAVLPYLSPPVRQYACTFGELQNGKVVEKGVYCKMARGRMVRFLAENAITNPEEAKSFSELGYAYTKEYSTKQHFVFLKPKENRRCP